MLKYKISKTSLLLTIVAVSILISLAMAGNVSAIINGEADNGRHPYVGLLVFDAYDEDGNVVPQWSCTGTLLDDHTVLCAGHCTDGAVAARFWVDEVVEENPEFPYGGETSYEGIPYTYPGYMLTPSKGIGKFVNGDVGIVILTEEVLTTTVSTYGELPEIGTVDELPMRQIVEYVGYGVQERLLGGGPPTWDGLLVRLLATGELVKSNYAWGDQFIRVSANPAQGKGGTCYGDSGGPVFIEGGTTVIAVTSFGTNEPCAGLGYYMRLDLKAVQDWISTVTGPLLEPKG